MSGHGVRDLHPRVGLRTPQAVAVDTTPNHAISDSTRSPML